MNSKYDITKITSDEAELIWNESEQSTIFTHPEVLKELAYEVDWWLVSKGEQKQCIWPVTLDENKKFIVPPFSYWQGPLWTKAGADFPNHRSISKTKPIYELFIETFIEKYQIIKASLHPSLRDVRVFDWWNYNITEKPRFTIKPRYTAVLQNLNLSIDTIQKNFRRNRRRSIKEYKKVENQFYFDTHCTVEEFIILYKKKLKIDKDVSSDDLISLLVIVKKGYGWIQAIRRKTDDMLCSLMIVFFSAQSVNLIINIALPEFKNYGFTTINVVNAIKIAKDKKIEYLDFNGANSPDRGDDKHSYDAEPVLYFDIEYMP